MNPIKSAGLMAYRLSEVYHDWRLGIATQGLVVPADCGAQAQGCHPYLALGTAVCGACCKTCRCAPVRTC